MNELDSFVLKIKSILNSFNSSLNIKQARQLIKELNEFLYTNYDGIGLTEDKLDYFSDFHKYWESHHKEILNVQIDDANCSLVADALHIIYLKTSGKAFSDIYDTRDLDKEAICRIRLLTANQDFRGSRIFNDLAKIYNADNSIFDEKIINQTPEDFIKNIQVTGLSQNDKRIQYAKSISQFLIDYNSAPYNILSKFDNDVESFKTALTAYPHSGYGNKKADMLIRDMVVLGVWDDVKNFDKINVASDINTIKVALRTGILKTAIPLVSSFLDIFCYQYGYIDEMNALAWRRVWEIWQNKYPSESITSPCLLDYFIYNIVGKQFCKEILYIFMGDSCNHQFKWHSGRNKTCQVCYNKGNYNKAHCIYKVMPCSDVDGHLAISKIPFAKLYNISSCPFKDICINNGNTHLLPPKSISIWGQTGWTTAYTKKDNGGGGLMA